MPVRPIAWVPFELGHSYPHMAKHDARIWESFIHRYTGYFEEAAYDVGLGGSETTDPYASDAEKLMWRWNTAKRVDALARNPDEVWLCEVRPGAGLSAVGAVLGYTYLSELDKWSDRPIIMTIVTNHTDNDTRLVCEAFEIQILEFPELNQVEPQRSS